jgi:hypothetical protein
MDSGVPAMRTGDRSALHRRRNTARGKGLPLLLLLVLAGPGSAAPRDDRYLEGYATAVLETRFGLPRVEPRVDSGVLSLDPAALRGWDTRTIGAALGSIEGVREVRFERIDRPRIAAAPAAEPVPETAARLDTGWLPPAKLFESLIADPRWPRFSGSVQFYQDDPQLDTVASANAGAVFPFYGWEGWDSRWQVGLQAGVFSIFDLEASSLDLVNADYFIALPLTFRHGPLSAQVRVLHQSSHLGDEFLLRNRVDRINLSFEALDLLWSWDFDDALRLYGGGGGMFRTDPEELKPWFAQGGFQLTSPYPVFGDLLYPVAALDVQATEEQDWRLNYSARAGLEFRGEWLANRRLQWLLEYFTGRSPNGQFFERHIEYFGTGIHFYF